MFVVMAVDATEAEINAVKGHIVGEGLTPFDHVGTERVVIAVVGEIGHREPVLIGRSRGPARGRDGHRRSAARSS